MAEESPLFSKYSLTVNPKVDKTKTAINIKIDEFCVISYKLSNEKKKLDNYILCLIGH